MESGHISRIMKGQRVFGVDVRAPSIAESSRKLTQNQQEQKEVRQERGKKKKKNEKQSQKIASKVT